MDSRIETYKHISIVQRYLTKVINNLSIRLIAHDNSKLVDPELTVFDECTEELSKLTYGSEEYKAMLAKMSVALNHHYANNSHHPEFHENGIVGMNLMDLMEMLCDWKAASERHGDGNIFNSIEINQKRFGYSDELKEIFINTASFLVFS